MQTTWTMLLVMDIMKLESPRAAISRMVFRHGRMQDTRMRRIAFGLVRKCTVHMAEASWDMTVAMAAPRIPIPLSLIHISAEGGHKVLLFSQFTSMLERLKQELVKEDISFYALDGSTPKLKRLELVESFNKDETQVFCISLKAGGTGLNLTAADIVIHFDPWWNVAVQNQATDRAHRIGQQNVVTVYKLIAKGTIEEKIVSLQEKKKELADKILGGEEMGMASFTKEELMDILRV